MAENSEPKRRLEEILPTPVRVQADADRGPRSRVVQHFRKLALGTVGLATFGCTGFGVVDPIPTPSRCIDVQAHLMGQATYVTDGVNLAIELTLTPAGAAGEIKLNSGSYVSGGTIIKETLNSTTSVLTVRFTANPPSGSVQVSVSAMCQNTYGNFNITMTASATAKAGDPVAVMISAG